MTKEKSKQDDKLQKVIINRLLVPTHKPAVYSSTTEKILLSNDNKLIIKNQSIN